LSVRRRTSVPSLFIRSISPPFSKGLTDGTLSRVLAKAMVARSAPFPAGGACAEGAFCFNANPFITARLHRVAIRIGSGFILSSASAKR